MPVSALVWEERVIRHLLDADAGARDKRENEK